LKVAIFAGGLGTRLGEETNTIPKPMVEIGGFPILWHIMKFYSSYGFNEFIILCGYKGEVIKDYFANYCMRNSDITVSLADNLVEIHKKNNEDWKVTLIYTGRNAMTGARLKKAYSLLKNESFMLTYGDGLSNINLNKLLETHKQSGKIATVTAVRPEGRFGALKIEKDLVTDFTEKKDNINSRINGGFFVLEPKIFDCISDEDDANFEVHTLNKISKIGQLVAYQHDGFWHCMDTLKDKNDLNAMWASGNGNAPWKVWND
jgi:glucose-1-phosphate cytidylyltransferase